MIRFAAQFLRGNSISLDSIWHDLVEVLPLAAFTCLSLPQQPERYKVFHFIIRRCSLSARNPVALGVGLRWPPVGSRSFAPVGFQLELSNLAFFSNLGFQLIFQFQPPNAVPSFSLRM